MRADSRTDILDADNHTSKPQQPSMANAAYEVLRSRLVRLVIRPGEPLDDDALGREMNMGRTPIRDALKRLEGDRLVVTYPKRGTFASSIEMTDVANILVVRERLEPLAASLAATNLTEQQRPLFEQLGEDLRRFNAADTATSEILVLDGAVHSAICEASGNSFLDEALTRLRNLSERIWHVSIERKRRTANLEECDELQRLVGAILQSDPKAAEAVMAEHIQQSDRRLREYLYG